MAAATLEHSAADAEHEAVLVHRLAGLGGLFFVAVLVVQNLLRAAAPSFDASPATVLDYFGDNRAAVLIPLGLFPLGMVALFAFTAGVCSGSNGLAARWWSNVGLLGVAAIASLFAVVNISEIVLAADAHQLAASPGLVRALWAVHAASFGLVLAAQALALLGLSRAAARNELIPRWIDIAALAGAACLLCAAVFTVAIVDGGPWIALGLLGFLVWGVFILATSIPLVRGVR